MSTWLSMGRFSPRVFGGSARHPTARLRYPTTKAHGFSTCGDHGRCLTERVNDASSDPLLDEMDEMRFAWGGAGWRAALYRDFVGHIQTKSKKFSRRWRRRFGRGAHYSVRSGLSPRHNPKADAEHTTTVSTATHSSSHSCSWMRATINTSPPTAPRTMKANNHG